MLDVETRRRIDTARDILVGKVPDPKSQVEQITIALIYKFMWDIEAQSEELGGKRSYFVGEFDRYAWPKLMHAGLGGHETLNLYAEALTQIPRNPGVPPLFRGIFDNAYLPYRDPETLREFLKVIDRFEYDHSERLGDAFEYLLSIMGAQGDAGQFRTPRHIIDFIVEVVDPRLYESVLDPACGTAGFLISAYKHIRRANTDADDQSTLTPHERGRLAESFTGYDISPDMVRLSRVNLYLHGFTSPDIHEYDTLTSEERWNERADVILANPPFMSPKGGIRPHSRFTVQSRRSEVLFVDYMAEHLTPSGRAGIIVPEGIIFQSQKAHTRLRRMLVEDYLVAVVSLPAGVFQPYSGVKTSILILNPDLARRSDCIAFLKVEHDGYDLGAQRRPIDRNDLPHTARALQEFLNMDGRDVQDADQEARPALAALLDDGTALIVEKERIAESGDYNLSAERYRIDAERQTTFPTVRLGDLLELRFGTRITRRNDEGTLYPVYGGGGESFRTDTFNREDDVVISRFAMSPECVRYVRGKFYLLDSGFTFSISKDFSGRVEKAFIAQMLHGIQDQIYGCARGHAQRNLDIKAFRDIRVPLPPLDVQRQIVAEIEGYQKVIDGAQAVVDNYRPHISSQSNWPMVQLAEACEINPDKVNPASIYPEETIFYIDISSVENGTGRFLGYKEVLSSEAPSRARRGVRNDDILISTVRPNLKAFTLLKAVEERAVASNGFAVLRARSGIADPAFIYASVFSDRAVGQMVSRMGKGSYPSINQSDVASIQIALPSISEQQAITAEIKVEQDLVAANRELVIRFESKAAEVVDRIWGRR